MRVLHITAVRSGSTGKTATDLRKILTEQGHEYRVAFSVPDGKPLGDDYLIGGRIDHLLHAFFSRLFGLQGYFSFFATLRFIKKLKKFRPDVVQLGNLHANFINLPLLFRYLIREKVSVVMILHDCWLFTGKCTHFTSRKCEKWKTLCNHCPALKDDNKSWIFDNTRKIFLDRKKWYQSLNRLTVIAVSDWEKRQAECSPLFSNATKIVRVYNWIDAEIFKPATKNQIEIVRKKYGLSSEAKYVITVGAEWVKGSEKTMDAARFAMKLPKDFSLIVVGRGNQNLFPREVIRIPYTENPAELATLYSMSCAYLHFSTEDTFGKVIAEAMACGTVPIVFDSTACGEVAGPFGFAVRPHDVDAMILAINDAMQENRRMHVRQYALDSYTRLTNIEDYWN